MKDILIQTFLGHFDIGIGRSRTKAKLHKTNVIRCDLKFDRKTLVFLIESITLKITKIFTSINDPVT